VRAGERKVGPGNGDDEAAELGVVTGLLLEPVGDWFTRGFESECCQLHHGKHHILCRE